MNKLKVTYRYPDLHESFLSYLEFYDTLTNIGMRPGGAEYNHGSAEFVFDEELNLPKESELKEMLRRHYTGVKLRLKDISIEEGVELMIQ